jgi:hypothetical protein
LSQWWTPPLRLQVSACSNFLMMCYVPSMAVFCKESIERCPGLVSRYFCKLLFTIPVAPMITAIIIIIIIIIIIMSVIPSTIWDQNPRLLQQRERNRCLNVKSRRCKTCLRTEGDHFKPCM